MPLDLDGAEFEVHPRSTRPTAKGAVAGGRYLRRRRQRQPNCTAMAGAFMHGVLSNG